MKFSTRNIVILSGIISVTALVVISWALFTNSPPDPQTADSQEKAEYLASSQFGRLDVEEKKEYLEKLRPSEVQSEDQSKPERPDFQMPELSDEQKKELMKNMMPLVNQWIDKRTAEYDQLSQTEQTARLDKMIDGIVDHRKKDPAGARRMKNLTKDRLNMFLEYSDPQVRGKIARFKSILEERMKERGVPVDL